MNDDVSVTRLSDDGWNERVPPAPRSRLRVFAVMTAVVIGCGVAAFLVKTVPGDNDRQVDRPDEVRVITFPDRTPGVDVTLTSTPAATLTGTTSRSTETTTTSSETSSETEPSSRTEEETSTSATEDSSTAPGTTQPSRTGSEQPTSPPRTSAPPTTSSEPGGGGDGGDDDDDDDGGCRWIWPFC
ncbi:hypothetical protein [Qaidamihabitans albus]|uniref:hypothetical protein n=1 Tax=Qaidamihabitans albus TaxID=2795733 RepID=UPI0018F12D13|nr:hypothetical protein [Qaidamihabitans albus]